MIIVSQVNKSIEVLLGGAVTTNQLPVTVSYVDILTTTQAVSQFLDNETITNGATPVTIVAAPGANHTLTIKHISIINKDTVAAVVTFRYNIGGTFREFFGPITLQPGDMAEYSS